jgi:VanZ family protein
MSMPQHNSGTAPWPRLAWSCRYGLPLSAWTVVILIVATRPSATLVSREVTTALGVPRELLQYPYHVGAFGILASLLVRCTRALGLPATRVVAMTVLGAVAVSLTSELLQHWVPTRTPAVRDLLLDAMGASVGIGTMWLCGSLREAG